MPSKLQIAKGVLAVIVVHDLIKGSRNTKLLKATVKENNFLAAQLKHSEFMILYLAQLLEDNEITLDDFDKIALSNPM